MTTTYGVAFIARIAELLEGVSDTELGRAGREAHLSAAMRRYSKDRPKIVVYAFAGDGGRFYKLSGVATGWDDDFSYLTKVVWDSAALVSSDSLPELLEADEYEVYDDGTYKYVLLTSRTLGSGTSMLVSYATPYTLSATGAYSTPANDFDAICTLAACFSCMALAAKYGQRERPSVSVDAIDYGGMTDKYLRLADKYEKQYRAMMGLDDEQKPGAAGVIVDWDRMRLGGGDYLFRNRRVR